MATSVVRFAAVVVAAGAAGAARAEVVGAWNMNGLDPAQSLVFSATTGRGMVDFTGFGAGSGTLAGTTLGAQAGEIAGDALSVIGNAYNGASMRIDCDTMGFEDLTFSFAVRRSSTGFAVNRLEYWGRLGWTTFATFGASSTSWELRSFNLAEIDELEQGFATLRISIDGATGSTGSIRFDNLSLTGTSVPAPGALALLGAAGLVGRRRRR